MGLNICKVGINTWFLDVRLKKAGKEKRRQLTFHGTKSQADERFIQLKRELKEGTTFLIPKTLENFRDVLLLYRKRRESLGEVDEARYRPLERDLGDVPIGLVAERLKEYVLHLRTNPCKQTGKPLSNASINRYQALACAAFNLAVNLELLDKTPLSKARFPKLREVARDRVLSEGERQRLLNTIAQEAPHLLPVTRYALQVPCRKSELVNMRRDDLDEVNNCIRVHTGTTKNDQGVDKPIPPDMVAYFRSLPAQSEYLFYREERGRYCTLGCFNKAWVKCLRLAGIRNFRFHDTRHIAVTDMIDRGTPEYVVQMVAGWKSPYMLKTYFHIDAKKSLALIRFNTGSGYQVDTAETKVA